jgi:hypothetical protein
LSFKLNIGMKVGNLQQVDDAEMSDSILIPNDSSNDDNCNLIICNQNKKLEWNTEWGG